MYVYICIYTFCEYIYIYLYFKCLYKHSQVYCMDPWKGQEKTMRAKKRHAIRSFKSF